MFAFPEFPLTQSVVSPRSRCPQCKKPIGSCDNIPVLSYILLGGRCRNCKKKISIRYPLIEALTATVSALIYLKFDIGFEWAVYFLFCAALIALAFIDADHRILPDVITLNGLWIGIAIKLLSLDARPADCASPSRGWRYGPRASPCFHCVEPDWRCHRRRTPLGCPRSLLPRSRR